MNIKEKIENHENTKYVGADSYSTYYDVIDKHNISVIKIKLTGEEISIQFSDYAFVNHIEKVLTAILEGGE